jgi:hypothetical protein
MFIPSLINQITQLNEIFIMISRKTVLLLADIITNVFSCRRSFGINRFQQTLNYVVKTDVLYDYLFENNYDPWFCNLAKLTRDNSQEFSQATRKLKELILKLHTGETQANVTPQWTWGQRQNLGQQYLENLAEDILNSWYTKWMQEQDFNKPSYEKSIDLLRRNLELDGYIYINLRLLAPEKDVLDTEAETGLLKNLFTSLTLANSDVAFHHLSLSAEHYESGNWDDSISNSRKFFECILKETVSFHSLTIKKSSLPNSSLEKPVFVREYLEKENLLETKETEALSKVYGLLSHTGSHPYMAEKDQARLLRHLALTLSQFVLLRLQGSIQMITNSTNTAPLHPHPSAGKLP